MMAGTVVWWALAVYFQLHVESCSGSVLMFDNMCSQPCKCTHQPHSDCMGLDVDCTYQNLTTIPPSIPRNAGCLNVKHNLFSDLPSGAFLEFAELRKLDLSFNKLTSLQNDTFQGLSKLQHLNLSFNNLSLNKASLPQYIFKDLTSLKLLSIEGNSKANCKMLSYRDDIFADLPLLSQLSLDGLSNGTPFGKGFAILKSLKSLQLFGCFDYVSNDTFQVFSGSKVEFLSIRSGKLYDVQLNAFGHFAHLKKLSLNYNTHLGFNNASKGWYGLQNTCIESLYLKSCNPIYNDIHGEIGNNFYLYLNNTRIKELYLDKNDIIYIEKPKFHVHLPYLEILSLSHNRLQRFWHELFSDLYYLKNLKKLIFDHQLRTLHYHGPDDTPVELKWKDGFLKPEIIFKNTIESTVILPPNLEIISLRDAYNFEQPELSNVTILGTRHLKYIDISDNHLTRALGPLKIQFPKQMVWSNFIAESNSLMYIDPELWSESCSVGLKIRAIDLKDNKLGQQLSLDENGDIWHTLRDLVSLNLSFNEIKILPLQSFKSLSKLESLNLSSNSLRTINFTLKHLPFLNNLDLSSNLFSMFVQYEMDALDKLIHTRGFSLSIDLSNNPLVCSCDSLKFLQWMHTSNVTFSNYDNYICFYKSKLVGLNIMFEKYIKTLKIQCASNVYVKAAASSFSAAFVLVVLSIFLYQHRWDIKLVILRLTAQGRKQAAKIEDRDQHLYDAFVAYHEDDKEWVMENLVPNLEGVDEVQVPSMGLKAPLRLCLHFRDFDAGTPITENIVEGITNSRKTILVLSNTFTQSQWCRFEIEMARMKCFDEGRNTTIVVMLEPVNTNDMTGSLKALVRRYSFLTWPHTPSGQAIFWARLKEAIAINSSVPCVCECGRVIKTS